MEQTNINKAPDLDAVGGCVTPLKNVERPQRSDAARRGARFGLEVGAVRPFSLRRRSRGRICPSFTVEDLLA
jgi:hypothetical protein